MSSFVGPAYVAMHKSVVSEIQAQKDRNAKAAQRSLHSTINSNYTDSPRLQPEIQEIVNGIRDILHEPGTDGIEESQVDSMLELAISSITIENFAEPKAEKILVRGDVAQSRKLYNIRFNLKELVSLLLDWTLLGQVTENDSIKLFVQLIKTVGKLYDLSLVRFDKIHAIIIQEWHRMNKQDGTVKEDDLVNELLRKYIGSIPDLTDEKIRHAVNELVAFRCAELNEGNLSITESLVIK